MWRDRVWPHPRAFQGGSETHENSLLSLLGGAAGVVLAVAGAPAIAGLLGWAVTPSLGAVAAAFAVATAVGAAAGSYPAWLALRLDPIEALRAE